MQEIMVKNRDVELYTKVHGNSSKPILMFLHGYPDCSKTWDIQVEALKDDYCILCFDMRGVGHSTKSDNRGAYRMDKLLSDIEAIINTVAGQDGKVHLIGHDWGSVIGWSFITEQHYARRILSYTSLSGPHLGLMMHLARKAFFSGNLTKVKDFSRQVVLSWYIYMFNLPVLPEAVLKAFGLPLWKKLLQENGVNPSSPYLDISQEEVNGITLNPLGLYRQNPWSPPKVPAPNGIKTPVQLIVATEDNYISDKIFSDYDRYVPSLTRQTLHAKHWAHHSRADEFNRLVSQFVQNIEQENNSRAA
ncbi:hypothetical protein A9Q81_00340 [Gammaproteobacteria bacterium 42_54_T18]|nr:hypothetical protein A9Q81_00340 [Gammaproteobacteria bacterium 42_54_T18]